MSKYKVNFDTSEGRKRYQKKYYRDNIIKAKAYQVAYNKKFRKAFAPKDSFPWLGVKKECLSLTDLSQAPPVKFQKMLTQILSGQVSFTK